MRSFDPDEDEPFVDDDVTAVTHLDDDLVGIDADAAVALLDAITADLPNGEVRDGQREMTEAVAVAISRGRHLVVEAGTGVGKSLAYLAPLVASGKRAVVATATKNLQDQLAKKDAPLVSAHVPKLRVAVLKGRGNYLCRLRVREVGGDAQLAFSSEETVPEGVTNHVKRILEWGTTTVSGDRDELGFEPEARAWRQLSVTPQECVGKTTCPLGAECFTELARERAANSDVVIVNTHLYGAHLSAGSTILPEHDVVVFDEAHEALDILAQLLGTSLNATRFRAVAALARGVLGASRAASTDDLLTFADRLDRALNAQLDAGATTGLGEELSTLLEEGSRYLIGITDTLKAATSSDESGEIRRQRALGPTVHLANDVARMREVALDELVYLTRRDKDVDLELSLVDVGPRLRKDLWPTVTGVLTSATIPENLVHDLGLAGECEELRVPSPFDYPAHSLLYVPDHLPTRTDEGAEAAIVEEIADLVRAAGGRTLALFTNRAVMRRVAESVREKVTTTVLIQDTLSRARLIERFAAEPEASLFAVTSYWQGVDVPGHSLSLVTIDRLPFSRPDDPLSQARRERAGDRAFYEVDVPRAAMLLAQGVGRLIRTTSDRGVVAVLDTRLATASYRSRLLRRLPPMKRTRDKAEVTSFLRAIDAEASAG